MVGRSPELVAKRRIVTGWQLAASQPDAQASVWSGRTSTRAWALLLALLACVAVQADTFIFGPQTFSGTGRAVVVRPSFTVATGGSGYTLRVQNQGVLAAFVVLNGRVVLRPSNFYNPPDPTSRETDPWLTDWDRVQRDWRANRVDQTVSLIEKPVTLRAGSNELVVAFISRIGTSFTLEIVKTGTDTTPPIITTTVVPPPNANGWNNSNVTVTFTCTDADSGIATCPAPQAVSSEGAKQVVSGTATDRSGNTASASVTLNIDKTAPVVSATQSPAANANGWNSGPVTVTFSATDSLSNVAPGSLTPPVTLSADGTGLSASGEATDLAGNKGSTTRTGINIDQAKPNISVALFPAPGAGGIYTNPVTAHFSCTDVGSGVDSCPVDQTFSAEGSNLTVSGTVTDKAGNSGSVTSEPFTILLGKPTISVALSPPPNANGWRNGPVTAHFTCLENGLPLAGCPTDQLITTEGANQTVTRSVTDAAGQTASVTSAPFNIDVTPPTATASSTPAANANGWNDAAVTLHFSCADALSGVTSCPADQQVSNEGVSQIVSGAVTDAAGNIATASTTINIDLTPPIVTLSSPTTGNTGTTVYVPSVTLSGTASDALSGVNNATCNGAPATVISGALSCIVSLTPGSNTIEAVVTDRAGNSKSASLTFTYVRVPIVTISAPANLSYTNITPTTVTGTVDDATATVTINSIQAPVVNGAFSIALPLAEGPNLLTATATTAGGASGTASLTVTLDTTPPHVTITSPPDQFVTTDASISVAGNVNDIVVGTVNAEQAGVKVNGNAADVANRTFLRTDVPLALGPNILQAVARDRVGNQATTQITVTRQPAATLAQIKLVSGNNQTAAIGSTLAAPLVVSVTDSAGSPVPGKPVIFKVTQNDGIVSGENIPAASSLIATTDAQGLARVEWKLGNRAGAGGNSVEAYSVGFAGTAIFTASGTQGTPAKIVVDSGNDQIGAIGQQLPKPFIAVVVDDGNNRLANVPVTFTVQQGGGSFGGETSFTVNSDPDGRVAATLTLGMQEGNANNVISATFETNGGFPAAFTASGRAAGDPAKTTITGVVLDNSNQPIPGVTIRAVSTNVLHSNLTAVQSATAIQTNAQGQFSIPQAPVGFVKLLIDGSTAQLQGTYPSLEYDVVTVAGQTNTVGQPIYLLPLNSSNQLCVTQTTGGGTLTIPEAPGFSLTFGPGQVTFPGGSKNGCVSVTVVHGDKVPMAPGFGQQPRFIVTIQPAGAQFNPPAPITLPNVDGLKVRAVTEMYSFDHDIGSFVAIGTGVVSDDGQVIRSSAGVGVLKAGWHCGGDPGTYGTAADCQACFKCLPVPLPPGIQGPPALGCMPISGASPGCAGTCTGGVCQPSQPCNPQNCTGSCVGNNCIGPPPPPTNPNPPPCIGSFNGQCVLGSCGAQDAGQLCNAGAFTDNPPGLPGVCVANGLGVVQCVGSTPGQCGTQSGCSACATTAGIGQLCTQCPNSQTPVNGQCAATSCRPTGLLILANPTKFDCSTPVNSPICPALIPVGNIFRIDFQTGDSSGQHSCRLDNLAVNEVVTAVPLRPGETACGLPLQAGSGTLQESQVGSDYFYTLSDVIGFALDSGWLASKPDDYSCASRTSQRLTWQSTAATPSVTVGTLYHVVYLNLSLTEVSVRTCDSDSPTTDGTCADATVTRPPRR